MRQRSCFRARKNAKLKKQKKMRCSKFDQNEKLEMRFFAKFDRIEFFGTVFFSSRMSMDVSGNRVSFSGNRDSLMRNRVSFNGNRISFSENRISISGNRMSISGNRVSYSGNRISFSGSRISFKGSRALYLNFRNMFARCPKTFSLFGTCLLGARKTCGRVAFILHHKIASQNVDLVKSKIQFFQWKKLFTAKTWVPYTVVA